MYLITFLIQMYTQIICIRLYICIKYIYIFVIYKTITAWIKNKT